MFKTIPIFLLLGFIACSVLAISSYRAEQPGVRLFTKYFSAVPMQGYSAQRSLAAGMKEADASIIRQAYVYHEATNYDLALVSFRAYLESNPVPKSDETLLLAGTAAVAAGEYAEGAEYLDQIEEGGEFTAEAWWYLALIDLQQGDLAAARGELKRVTGSNYGQLFPVKEVLGKIPVR
ncbi:MAG: tetratricopeptide (TPR) repeat protein [Neolewinella sp.]